MPQDKHISTPMGGTRDANLNRILGRPHMTWWTHTIWRPMPINMGFLAPSNILWGSEAPSAPKSWLLWGAMQMGPQKWWAMINSSRTAHNPLHNKFSQHSLENWSQLCHFCKMQEWAQLRCVSWAVDENEPSLHKDSVRKYEWAHEWEYQYLLGF